MEPAVICAENIALLHLLHQVPSQPIENRVELKLQPHPGYSLPFETERLLASALAFLAGTRDGPDHIPAVCLKELPASKSLDVLIAVNKAKWADGDVVLRELEKGFQGVFHSLTSVTNGDVFMAIIKMCSRRIQCRLRFTPNYRKKDKPPIRKVLQDSVDAVKQLRPPPAGARMYLEQTRDVMKKITAWSTHQTPERLGELVTTFHDLSKIPGLGDLLNAISHKSMELSARKSLLNIIGKVGRYRGIAVFLCQVAAEHPALRRTQVVPVRLADDFFRKTSVTLGSSNLPGVVSRFRDRYGGRYDMTNICRIIGLKEQQANSQFVDQMTKSLKTSRIHAEIQLIFYCELEDFVPPPRAICSSKDACFLCNTFILMHGKFHTPRCHGKLYPGWRLPNTDLGTERQRFNDRLQQQIEDSLALLISRRAKTVFLDPNESTLLTLPRSKSTLNSDNSCKNVEGAINRSGGNSSLPSYCSAITMNGTDRVEREEPNKDITSDSDSSLMLDTSPSVSFAISNERIFTLTPGREVFFSIEQNIPAIFGIPGRLEVHVEHSSDSQIDRLSSDQPKIGYHVEWLTEQGRRSGSGKARIIDAELLESEVILPKSEVQNLWLLAKGEVLRIRAAEV